MGKKRMKGIITDREDRISNLPESLIHHILSFLVMRDVIRTCLLSKRWRNIWKSVPVLDFDHWLPGIPGDTEFIAQSLIHYEGQKIKKFYLRSWHIDGDGLKSWVRFAVNRGVEELDVCSEFLYPFPECLFECLELRVLKWSGVPTKCPPSLCFPSLKELHLGFLELSDLDTSACPLLEVLTLDTCDNLSIYAPNRKLRYLKITEIYDINMGQKCFTLYAPNLLCIEFNVSFIWSYKFKDLSSVKTASLEYLEPDNRIHKARFGILQSLMEFLRNCTHVESLKLCQTCIQILAYGETEGLEIPSLSATCLELRTSLSESMLVGIASLLKASRCMERLIINMNCSTLPDDNIFEDLDIDAIEPWESLEHALSTKLLHLSTILIENYPGCHRNWSPCRTALNIEKFLKYCDFEIELVEVLLKSSKVLNKMNISIIKLPSQPLKLQFLDCLTMKLLVFPRVSSNAEVYFS